jgi:hypothetical protein
MLKVPRKIWDNCKLIGEIQKSPSTRLRVELVARDGVKYINVREWYIKKSEGIWKPGMSGLAIPVQLPIDGNLANVAHDLTNMVLDAVSQSSNFAIEDESNAVYAKE